MKRFSVLLFIILLTSLATLANGVDDQNNPNDPTTNDRANACFEDGSMAGKCESDWEWTCGWYLIRWEQDSSYAMPLTCEILQEQTVEAEIILEEPIDCKRSNLGDFSLTGSFFSKDNGDFYRSTDGSCTGGITGKGTLISGANILYVNVDCAYILGAGSIGVLAGGDFSIVEYFCILPI